MSKNLLIVLAAINAVSASATTIDFNSFADGTLVSAGNPYAGTLNVQARAGVPSLVGQDVVYTWHEATIENGVVQILPPVAPPLADFISELTAVFLQPVAEVSFDVASRRSGTFDFTAVNGLGQEITGSGLTGTSYPAFNHVSISLPVGYGLTQLRMHNDDPLPQDAALWVDNFSFRATSVPDGEGTAVLLFCGILAFAAMRQQERRIARRA